MRFTATSLYYTIRDIRKSFIFMVVVTTLLIMYSLIILNPEEEIDDTIFVDAEDSGSMRPTLKSHARIFVNPLKWEDQIQALKDQELKKMGFESIDRHSFKSPYIINPSVYNENISKLLLNNYGHQETKLISITNSQATPWIDRYRFNSDSKYCKYKCDVDFTGMKYLEADLVIFLCGGLSKPKRPRREGQLWALLCWESARHWRYKDYDFWRDQFNMTISYRLDSDIFIPYVQLGWRHSSLLYTPKEYRKMAEAKTKTATWWVSNCRGRRTDFIKEMQKYIDIDIFGKCGKEFDCMSNQKDFNCRKMFNTTYKFYLAFENSFCQDYVTEKFNKLFLDRPHIIPVVKGAANYNNHFPKNTIINANDFKSPKELALYLKDLANDLPRYSEMLQEKDRLLATPRFQNIDWCAICESLHTKKFGIKRNIKTWSHLKTCIKHGYGKKDEV